MTLFKKGRVQAQFALILLSVLFGIGPVQAESSAEALAAWEMREVLERTASFAPSSNPLDQALARAITDPTQACQFAYLKRLGWRVVESLSGKVEIIDGSPCNRGSLKAAQEAGELTIGLPWRFTTADLNEVTRTLSELTTAGATLCADKLKVADAAIRAIRRLQKNEEYRFTDPEQHTGFMDLGAFQGLRMGWRPLDSLLDRDGFAYMPFWKNSTAIRAIYEKPARMECAAGLQFSEHAIQYELYGEPDYDDAFHRREIVIGTWEKAGASDSAIHGRHAGRRPSDSFGVQSALLGGQAFVGRTGYLGNVFGEKFLDEPNDRGENLLIVSITPAASHEIAMSDGLAKYNGMMRRVWDLLTANQKLKSVATDEAKAESAANSAEIEKILANPFFSGIKTYTHPFKTLVTLRAQLIRLWNLNPRTPYAFRLYADVINFGLYDRHREFYMNQCLDSGR